MITIALRWTWCILTSTAYQVLTLPLDILGAVVVPFAILFGHNQPDITGTKTIYSAPKWLWLWGNQQDGYDPEWAVNTIYKGWPVFLRRYSWAAWRNKSSNKRFILWLHPAPEPERIGFIQGRNWWICWQGWAHNWQWVRKKSWTEIGWRYEPKDAQGVAETDWRQYGCGVAFRLRGKL
jgi:hypothetical protein